MEYFSNKGDKYEIMTLENRGMALSDTVSGRWTTAKMAKDVLKVLDHVGWTRDVNVVGLSMGGMIAQEVCRQGKGRFASLTLLSTIAGGIHSLWYFVLSIPTGLQLLVRTLFASNPKDRLKSALRILYPDAFLAAEVPHPHDSTKTTTNFHIFKEMMIKRSRADLERGIPLPSGLSMMKQVLAVTTHNVPLDELDAISKSVKGNCMVLTGDEDVLVHMANSERLAKGLKPRKHVILKGAGHGAFEQFANEVNSAIEDIVLGAAEARATHAKL